MSPVIGGIIAVILILVIISEIILILTKCRSGHPQLKILALWRYAHRGFHDKPSIPENSIAAFKRAIENNFGAELDVHLMKDGNLAVIHDSNLLRTAGVDVCIEDLETADLAKYRLEGTDEMIPLFDDVLSLFDDKTPLIVELKAERGNHDELTAAAVKMLDNHHVKYCIESFDPRCIQWLKKNRPEIVRGQLSEQFLKHGEKGRNPIVLFILANLFTNFLTHPDFIAYNYADRDCIAVQICRKFSKVQEVSWTIRSMEDMKKMEAEGNIVIFEKFNPKEGHE